MRRKTKRGHRLGGALLVLSLMIGACGSSAEETADDGSTIVDAGSFRVELPDEITVVDDTPAPTSVPDSGTGETAAGEQPAEPAGAGDDAIAAEPTPDPDEIPLEDDTNAISGLFDSFDTFSSCLERLGTVFLGVPDPAVPETVDPTYIENLTTCAAQSNILQAIEDAEQASADRTPEETEQFNVGLLIFVDCMRGKGWTIADPEPDANGALQIGFNGEGFVPPPGESLIGNPNLRECGAEATREATALAEAEEASG